MIMQQRRLKLPSILNNCKCKERIESVKQGKIYFRPLQKEWWLSIREGYYSYIHTIEVCPYCREKLPEEYDLEIKAITS